jgi:hypothetical protein
MTIAYHSACCLFSYVGLPSDPPQGHINICR